MMWLKQKCYPRIKFLGSLQLGLLVMSGTLFAILLAAFLPQPSNEQQINSPFMQMVIGALDLNHIYSSWWFISCGLLLTINMGFCILKRSSILRRQRSMASLGSLLLHSGLILVIIGSGWSYSNRKEQVFSAFPGQLITLSQNGFPFDLQVKNFAIKYDNELQPQQYSTRVYVVDEGVKRMERTISVNHPLAVQGATTCQMGYGWILKGEVIKGVDTNNVVINPGQLLKLPTKPYRAIKLDFASDYLTNKPRSRPRVSYVIYSSQKIMAKGLLMPGETTVIEDITFKWIGYDRFSILKAKIDPGLPAIYLGFGILTVGMFMRYLLNTRMEA